MRTILTIPSALLLASTLALATNSAAQPTIYGGSVVNTGLDCVGSNNLLYQRFPAGTFDLDNAVIEYIPNGNGSYVVVPSGLTALPFGAASATAIDLALGDDEITGVSLGFPFPYPSGQGGSIATSGIEVSSNGYVYLLPSTVTTSRCCHGGQNSVFNSFLNDGPSFALFGSDLDPFAGGTVWFDVQTLLGQQVAVITWDSVPAPWASANCQIQLWDDGRCVMTWFGVNDQQTSQSILVGWSEGGGQPDFGPVQFFGNFVDGGSGHVAQPFKVSSAMQPIVGDLFTLDITGMPPGTALAALLVGAVPTAIDLAVIGASGCGLYTNGDIATIPLVLGPGAMSSINFGVIPVGATGNAGVVLETQAIAVVPGFNPLGLASSNGARITIGTDISTVTGLIVRLEGTSVSNPQAPFWSVENQSTTGEVITQVKFDLFNGGPSVANGISNFDPDGNPAQFSSTGDFVAGNSSVTGGACLRLNAFYASDWATGLIYAGTPLSPCDFAANTGWLGSNPLPGGFGTIRFNFNSFGVGDTFNFDCDVDGGPEGANGLHEVLVTITTDQRTVSGQMVAIDDDTAIIAF